MPLFATVDQASVKPVTLEPLIPLPALVSISMSVKLGEVVEERLMPAPVERWTVPPDPAEPVPVTVSPPEDPVLERLIPSAAPLAEMLWKLSPLAPIVVAEMLRVVAVVVVRVLPVPVVVMVPPPVAVNAGLVAVLAAILAVKLMVAPVFEASVMPLPLSVI